MVQIVRKVGALALAFDLYLSYRWVPSERNGADPPSRGLPLSAFRPDAAAPEREAPGRPAAS